MYLNAAITAYDVQREIRIPAASDTRVVYSVFDLVDQRVRCSSCKGCVDLRRGTRVGLKTSMSLAPR